MRRALLICLSLSSCPVYADELPTVPSQLESRGVLTTDGGSRLELPPGWWIVPPQEWDRIDTEATQYQLEIIRLDAENKSLRSSLWGTWKWVAGAVIVGAVGGYIYGVTR